MVSMISSGVMVQVETFYQQDYSNPLQHEYMHCYKITIENHNGFPVKLHSRHWFIFDSDNERREVEGEGVVGAQPIIENQCFYEYVSGCNLHTEIGKMHGTYLMENLHSKEFFEVNIPAFDLVAPFKLN